MIELRADAGDILKVTKWILDHHRRRKFDTGASILVLDRLTSAEYGWDEEKRWQYIVLVGGEVILTEPLSSWWVGKGCSG